MLAATTQATTLTLFASMRYKLLLFHACELPLAPGHTKRARTSIAKAHGYLGFKQLGLLEAFVSAK